MGSESEAEATTWSRAREGDGTAFAQLFRLHQARVYRRALSMVDSAHDAEDVTAATFFELWRKRRTVRVVDGTVLPWLLVTTVNLARNHRRGAGRYRSLIASLPREEATAPESTDPTSIEAHVLGSRLAGAVAGLSSTDAALLTLTALEDLSVTDAAAAVGIKPGAARMRLHRARLRLQTALTNPAALAAQAEGEHA